MNETFFVSVIQIGRIQILYPSFKKDTDSVSFLFYLLFLKIAVSSKGAALVTQKKETYYMNVKLILSKIDKISL